MMRYKALFLLFVVQFFAVTSFSKGLDEAVRFVDARPDLDAYFIHTDNEGKIAVYQTRGMEQYLSEPNAPKQDKD